MVAVGRSDTQIQQDLFDELAWDRETEATHVGVDVIDGIVTLTGIVDTPAEKLAAEQAAFRVEGVRAVANDLMVHPQDDLPTDTSIARVIATAFDWSTAIPRNRIRVRVADRRVTLRGEVDWPYQRTAAEDIVHRVLAVRDVFNLIVVHPPDPSPEEIRACIERALVRAAELDAESIEIACEGGDVTLMGAVRSWAERREAEAAALNVHGVTNVNNFIHVRPPGS